MNRDESGIAAAALDWVIRSDRDDFDDWAELTAWLDADPRHAPAYAALRLRDDEAAEVLAGRAAIMPMPVMAAPMPSPRPVRSMYRYALPLAASLLLALGIAIWLPRGHGPGPQLASALTTRAGESRAVTLADGTHVDMAGDSRMTVSGDGRQVALESGRAVFSVEHDARHPFAVSIAGATVTDVGTVFDLQRRDDGFDLAVGEGAVRIGGLGGGALTVRAGQGARVRGGAAALLPMVTPTAVGGWRSGRYSYADATIADVAADITRATGAEVRVTPALAGRHFAGTLQFGTDAESTLRAVAPVLGLAARRDGGGWVLEPPGDAARR